MAMENNRRFFLAFVNHLLWSTQAVASRYLQVYAKPRVFDGQGVLATAKAASAILIFTSAHLFCPETPKESSASEPKLDQRDDLEVDSDDQESDAIITPTPPIRTKVVFALLFGMVATCRAATNIASSKFTLSYYVTTINSLTPLVVSIGDSLLLRTELPPAIWPCVVASVVGCATIGLAQSPLFSTDNSNYAFTYNDAIGCFLQLTSMCFSAAARLLMKRTEHILTRDEAVQTNNICNTAFPLLYTLVTNPRGWIAFRYMSGQSFLAWVTVAVLVYTIGSTGQMSLVRSMGPGMYSSLSAVRVLASAIVSAIWLNEPVKNWLEWVGLLVTMITMTAYTVASIDFNPVGRYTEVELSDDHQDDKVDDDIAGFRDEKTLPEEGEAMEVEMTDPLKSDKTYNLFTEA